MGASLGALVSQNKVIVTAIVLFYVWKSRSQKKTLKQAHTPAAQLKLCETVATLDIRRKAQIAYARATDHVGEVP